MVFWRRQQQTNNVRSDHGGSSSIGGSSLMGDECESSELGRGSTFDAPSEHSNEPACWWCKWERVARVTIHDSLCSWRRWVRSLFIDFFVLGVAFAIPFGFAAATGWKLASWLAG